VFRKDFAGSALPWVAAALAGPLHFKLVHRLVQGDARDLSFIPDEALHLVLTSPPYWNLKRYNESEGQMGHIKEYEQFLAELTRVWREAFRVLVPGGRLVCVVGDVCLSRRENNGRHTVVPLHADICVQCRKLGFDNLNPIIWHKISNASYEVSNGSKFLGKPYEPNAIIKNDIEFIVNPMIDIGFGENGDVTFATAARLARNFGESFALGIEYYTGLGSLQSFGPFNEQQHNIYAVTDFKVGRWDVNAGIGYGLTSASDRWMVKMIIGTELNEGTEDKTGERKMMRRPASRTGGLAARPLTMSEALLPRLFND
jgi:hypothetical protein